MQCRRGYGPTQHDFHSLIVVTSAYHMPRALAELEHQLPNVALVPYPVVSDRLRVEPWWANGDTTKLVLSEYLKYLFAELRMRFELVCGGQPRRPDFLRIARRAAGAPAGGSKVCNGLSVSAIACCSSPARFCSTSLFYVNVIVHMIVALPTLALPYRFLRPFIRSYSRTSLMAVARDLRHQGRMARGRENSARRLHRRLQTSIVMGDILALRRA